MISRRPSRTPRRVRAIGPTVSRLHAVGKTPSVGTRPARRPVAGDPAERSRDPDRAGRVGAERDVDEPGRDGRAAAAARAAGRSARGPTGCGPGPKCGLFVSRAERELVRVQLPDDRRAGRPQPRDALGVAVGDAVRGSSTPPSSACPATSITSLTATRQSPSSSHAVQEGVVRVERHGAVSGGSRSSISAQRGQDPRRGSRGRPRDPRRSGEHPAARQFPGARRRG